MLIIASGLGFGLIIGPLLDAYAGVYAMVRAMFLKSI